MLFMCFKQRPKTGDKLCKSCFYWAFEEEIHHTITSAKLFEPGDFVAIAASGNDLILYSNLNK